MTIAPDKYYLSSSEYSLTLTQIIGGAANQHKHDFSNIPHRHNFSELVVVYQGVGEYWQNGIKNTVYAGNIFVVQGDIEHYFPDHDNLEFFNIIYDTFEPKFRIFAVLFVVGQ